MNSNPHAPRSAATVVTTTLTALFFTTTTLRFTLLATLGDAGLLVEAATLQLTADAFAADLSLQTVERAVNIIISNFNLNRS